MMVDTLRGVAKEYFADLYQVNPSQATEIGIHEYDEQLDAYSAPALSSFVGKVRKHLRQLEHLDGAHPLAVPPGGTALTLKQRDDLELLRSDMQRTLIWYDRLPEWRRNPDLYPSTALFALYPLCVRDFAPVEQRLRSVLARLKAVPDLLAAGTRNLKSPPQVFTAVAVDTAEGAVEFFQGQIPGIAKQVPALEPELLDANGAALVAFTNYIDFLKTRLLRRSSGRFAVGKELFEELLRVDFMLDISSEELADLGQRAFAETQAALRRTAAAIDPNKNWPTLVSELRKRHPAPHAMLQTYRDELARLRAFVVEHDVVTIPPNAVLEVIATPSFARSTTPYAAYMPPAPFEKSQKGQFWVTPIDESASPEGQEAQLEEHNYHSLPLTAIHEAYPGHHVQLVTSNEASDDIRKHFSSTIFAEGWALYCEQLMVEQGYLKDKPAQLFQLKDQLWRAARVIIDVGLHTGHMTIEEAVRLLVDEVYLAEPSAVTEVRRYTMTPTQPASYTLGKLEILRMREKYAGVPLRRFHDLLLSCGTVPPAITWREVAAKADGVRAANREAGPGGER